VLAIHPWHRQALSREHSSCVVIGAGPPTWIRRKS
jgi:hypothetical protein